jgi:C-terminal processing protease CtpA/Prc
MPSRAWSPAWIRIPSISTKSRFKEFREGTSGRFVGVGIEITQEDGLIKVVSPIEGSPATAPASKPTT